MGACAYIKYIRSISKRIISVFHIRIPILILCKSYMQRLFEMIHVWIKQ